MSRETDKANNDEDLSIGEVALRFLAGLSSKEVEGGRQEVYKFVRWLGWDRRVASITAAEVARYAEQQLSLGSDSAREAQRIRAFLSYLKKAGYVKNSLASQLKVKRDKSKLAHYSTQNSTAVVSLTREGHGELEAQLDGLKSRRLEVIDEMRRAAADKDFRENAPLQAAREERGYLEGRITELEATLKSASIIDEKQPNRHKIGIGDSVILHDLNSGEEVRYTIVSSREVDLSRGKISSVSPLGKAVVGRGEGEIIEVETPAGKLRYQLKESGFN